MKIHSLIPNFTMENGKVSPVHEEDDLTQYSSQKNDDLVQRFTAFQRKDVSLLSQIILLIMVSVGSFFFRVVTLVHEQTLNIFLFAYAIFVIMLGWSAFILRRFIFLKWNSVHQDNLVKYLNRIEKLWFFHSISPCYWR